VSSSAKPLEYQWPRSVACLAAETRSTSCTELQVSVCVVGLASILFTGETKLVVQPAPLLRYRTQGQHGLYYIPPSLNSLPPPHLPPLKNLHATASGMLASIANEGQKKQLPSLAEVYLNMDSKPPPYSHGSAPPPPSSFHFAASGPDAKTRPILPAIAGPYRPDDMSDLSSFVSGPHRCGTCGKSFTRVSLALNLVKAPVHMRLSRNPVAYDTREGTQVKSHTSAGRVTKHFPR
jgi:hypothetical protein